MSPSEIVYLYGFALPMDISTNVIALITQLAKSSVSSHSS